ncbi:MAG TPA: hypothetical protein VGM64_14700 [Lacunisphaera sp.]
MQTSAVSPSPRPAICKFALFFFGAALAFSLWAATVGWKNGNLRGGEFRQAQTALSTYFIQQEHNFSPAYPTPVLGKPWSIPLEFPLYQWTVVGLGNVTGLDLTTSARLISLACFYLMLPAVFLLLGDWNVPIAWRWLILGLIVSCPLYILYARAFLMETMALTMSVWFLAAYWRGLKTGKWGWLLAAAIFGTGAGLVKVTTFMLYLIPAATVTLWLLWRQRPTNQNPGWGRIGRILALGALATAVPFAATLWWMHFADVAKAANPAARFLQSENLHDFIFGTGATRFSAAVWAGHWLIFRVSVVWLPLAVISGAALIFFARGWRGKILFCLACFVGIQVLFPVLYAWHDYYYVANTLFVLVAMGLAVSTLLESSVLPPWVGRVVIAAMLGGQAYFFCHQFYGGLSAMSPEGSDMTRLLRQVTRPDDVLLIQGEDWNSMIPYYARRRALMLKDGADNNEAEIRDAFRQLKGEQVSALITTGNITKDAPLMKLAVEYFGFNPQALFTWNNKFLYFVDKRWQEVRDNYEKSKLVYDVRPLVPGKLAPDPLAGHWAEAKQLRPDQLAFLRYMRPTPVRFLVRYGLSLGGNDSAPIFGAHPESRFQFLLAAGPHHLRTSAGLSPGAYENIPADQASDGIDVTVRILKPGVPDQVVFSRNLNPRDKPAERGAVPIDVSFEMPPDAKLELSITPGPAGSDRRDWAYLGKLVID